MARLPGAEAPEVLLLGRGLEDADVGIDASAPVPRVPLHREAVDDAGVSPGAANPFFEHLLDVLGSVVMRGRLGHGPLRKLPGLA